MALLREHDILVRATLVHNPAFKERIHPAASLPTLLNGMGPYIGFVSVRSLKAGQVGWRVYLKVHEYARMTLALLAPTTGAIRIRRITDYLLEVWLALLQLSKNEFATPGRT